MSVEKDEVKRVAKLARLSISEEQTDKMTKELNGILDWVGQLNEVDVSSVEPMTSVLPMPMKKREDIVTAGNIAETIVANASAQEDHYFMVPKVIE